LLQLRHACNVASHFLVDILNAAVDVLKLLGDLGNVPNPAGRTYGSPGTSFSSLSSPSFATFYSGPSWYPGRIVFSFGIYELETLWDRLWKAALAHSVDAESALHALLLIS
jgi:acetyl esterase/lipase